MSEQRDGADRAPTRRLIAHVSFHDWLLLD